MNTFEEVASGMVTYQLRSSWLAVSKLYNELAKEYDSTLAMAFVLLAIDDQAGTPVTKIAPRIGMEPNSLSRLLNSLEEKGAIFRQNDTIDQRKVFVCLTDLGKEYRKIAIVTVFELEKELTANLKPEQLATFFEVMNQVPIAVKKFRTMHRQMLREKSLK
jgi:MarR family transcriptional regulator, organic hydroperoxide resistance regulator